MSRGRSQLAGFSLIEMLVALVILSLSLGVLYQAASGATRNVRVAGEYSEALILAESLLSENAVLVTSDAGSEGAFGAYRWRVAVTPLTDEDLDVPVVGIPLAEVTVVVQWGEDGPGRELELATVVPLLAVGP